MRRIATVILLALLIAAVLLYAAHLDGDLQVKAFASQEQECETCKLIRETDLVETGSKTFMPCYWEVGRNISFELAMYLHFVHGHNRVDRRIMEYNVPYNYCPECGRRIDQQDIYVLISDPKPVPKPTDYQGVNIP